VKICHGQTFNLSNPLICKVALTPVSEGATTALVCRSDWPAKPDSFGVLIVGHGMEIPERVAVPVFQTNGAAASFEDGDVVLIEPSQLTVLYRKTWISNSVMPTERCNSQCLMCPQPPRRDSEDLVAFSLQTISLMDLGTRAIGITGGEPTLAWPGLIEILNACKTYLPEASIQLLTNGRILNDFEKAKELAGAGGERLFVGVPLYGDISEVHDTMVGVKGAFWETLEGIYNLERAGVFVELRTVVTKYNYLRLPQWAEYVYRTMPFVGHIALMGLEPVGLAATNLDKLWIDPVDYAQQLEKAVKILRRRDMAFSIFNHQLCTLSESIWSNCVRSISEWKTVYMPECHNCLKKLECGGFFSSAEIKRSRHIKPLGCQTSVEGVHDG
jgi:His-Xaa-Ser system radical SAM maturase HxsC